MDKNVPTILKSFLQSFALLNYGSGVSYPVLANSTLNQKLNIQSGLVPNPGELPLAQFVVLGNGGMVVSTGADGFAFAQSYAHSPIDTGLFHEIPFIIRPVGSDLSDVQRQNYRLRTTRQGLDGNTYFVYYGRVLNTTGSPLPTPTLQKREVVSDGSDSTTSFTFPSGSLTPTPQTLSPGQDQSTEGAYITATTTVNFVLSPTDIAEILAACTTLYGSSDYAVISEIALCSGVNRTVQSLVGSTLVNYTEAVSTQVMSFLSTNFPAPSFSNGATYSFDVGNSEPLFILE